MSTFDLQRNALGNGGCSVAEGERTSGGGAASAAANLALWFALFVAPLLLLRSLRSGKKAVRKAGLLLLPAALLFASGAQAGQFFGKTQRLHRTTDGLGAFTIDTDEMIPKGKFVGTFAANYVKRPINKGNVQALTVEEDRVHNLLTVKLEGAYGLTPDFSVGVDLPYNFVQDAKDAGGADITDNDFGDIRVNGEWRIVSKATWGVAFLPVVVSPTGDKDAFLTQRKFSDGGKIRRPPRRNRPAHVACQRGFRSGVGLDAEFLQPRSLLGLDPFRGGGHIRVQGRKVSRRGKRRDDRRQAVLQPDRDPDRVARRVQGPSGKEYRV